MAKLVWDPIGEHFYEQGSDHCVLFLLETDKSTGKTEYSKGVAWNGFRGLTETRSGADLTKLWANNAQYGGIRTNEEFGGTITAYTAPEEFEQCDGSVIVIPGVHFGQQPRKAFGLCYRTQIGNDTEGLDFAYKLHFVYGATCNPSNREYTTRSDSVDAMELSWDFDTTPMEVEGYSRLSHLEVESNKVDPEKLKALEDIIYGTADADSKLPMPLEVLAALKSDAASEPAVEG